MASRGTARLTRDFQWFWFSQTMSFTGDRLTGFAIPTIAILLLDASSAQVGLLTATGWLAFPVFGMFAGAVLARMRVRRVMIAGELVRFCAFAGVTAAVVLGEPSFPQLLVATALAGAAMVFVDIGAQSYLPSLVPADRLFPANSRLQSSDSLSKLAGPAVAGAVVDLVGPAASAACTAAPFLLSAAGRTRVRAVEPSPERHPEPAIARVRRGLGFVWRHDALRRIVSASALRGFGMGAVDAVLLLFAYRVLGMSSTAVGLLLAAGALGGLAGAMYAHRIARRLGVRRTLLLSGLEGAAWIAVPLCLAGAPVAVFAVIRICSAIWLPVWGVLSTSLRQVLTPPEWQSTVHATARTVPSTAIPLGALTGGVAAGLASDWLGTAVGLVAVLMAGGICASTGVLLLRAIGDGIDDGLPAATEPGPPPAATPTAPAAGA
ncbi:MFS transporter [Marinactinospora rubrisoli]|uniref:MFS transporter n=1 Tax=Marinactinospora rubrisoli TaxID=2715399 RepID=A0ABW2KIN1_9ACTN